MAVVMMVVMMSVIVCVIMVVIIVVVVIMVVMMMVIMVRGARIQIVFGRGFEAKDHARVNDAFGHGQDRQLAGAFGLDHRACFFNACFACQIRL